MPNLVAQETLDIKYRPKTFKSLIGQDHIVRTLQGMFKSRKIDRAIMLHGPTGSGKTTIARIIARYANCQCEKYLNPGNCYSCQYKNIKQHPDLHEINMANDTGVEDIRELISQSKYMPETNFRIFLLDEFQMASKNAKDCLLKALEEPESKEPVLWIICTTEPEKCPDTLLGRCTKLQVRPVPVEILAKYLKIIAKAEKSLIQHEDKSLLEIAQLVHGQPRAGLKVLGSVIHYYNGYGKINTEIISKITSEILNTASETLVSTYLLSIYAGKYTSAFKSLKATNNIEYFLKALIDYHTNVLYSFVNKSLVTNYFPSMRLIKEAHKIPNLSKDFLSKILIDLGNTYSQVKNYTVDVTILVNAMTCRLIGLLEKRGEEKIKIKN